MAYREVPVFEVREVLRLWIGGQGYRSIAGLVPPDRKTVTRMVEAAVGHGGTVVAGSGVDEEGALRVAGVEQGEGGGGDGCALPAFRGEERVDVGRAGLGGVDHVGLGFRGGSGVEGFGRSGGAGVASELPPENSRTMRFLEPGEVVHLVDCIDAHYRPLVLTAAYIGLRWGELIGLRVANVDLERHTIRVEEQLQEVHGKMVLGPPKTKAGIRTVTMPATLTEILRKHFECPAVRSSTLAFPGPMGASLRGPNFRRVWLRARKRAGFDGGRLDGFVFHELRHTAAALAIAQGAHPMAIKERLGHASITTTLDRYGGLFPRLDETIAAGLDDMLRDSLGLTRDESCPSTDDPSSPPHEGDSR
jgi:hypothetical protein